MFFNRASKNNSSSQVNLDKIFIQIIIKPTTKIYKLTLKTQA